MLRLTFRIKGQKDVDLLLSRIGERSSNLRQPLTEILASMRHWMGRTFKTEGGYPGPKWRGLDEAYAALKARQFAGRTVLRRSDKLYKSLTRRTAGSVGRVGKNRLEYGTTIPYAEFHQEGTRKMPARPPLRFIERDVRRWIRIFQVWAFPKGATR